MAGPMRKRTRLFTPELQKALALSNNCKSFHRRQRDRHPQPMPRRQKGTS